MNSAFFTRDQSDVYAIITLHAVHSAQTLLSLEVRLARETTSCLHAYTHGWMRTVQALKMGGLIIHHGLILEKHTYDQAVDHKPWICVCLHASDKSTACSNMWV